VLAIIVVMALATMVADGIGNYGGDGSDGTSEDGGNSSGNDGSDVVQMNGGDGMSNDGGNGVVVALVMTVVTLYEK